MWRNLKGYFITGLLVLIPIILTLFLLFQVLNQIDHLLPYNLLGIPKIPGLGTILVLLLILLTGIAARNYAGRKFLALGDRFVAKVPIISRIYEAIKQILHTFLADSGELFKKVVLIECPRKGIYSLGFFMRDTRGLVHESIPDDLVSVFVPHTPNPTSGYLIFVPKSEVREINMSIEDAMKLIVSGGAMVPKRAIRRKKITTVDHQPSMAFTNNS